MQSVINDQLGGMISFMDSAENFYHGFMTGVLGQSKNYRVKSNRESGNGRGDLFVFSPDLEKKAYVLELKTSESFPEETEKAAREGVQQIIDKKYAQELFQTGYVDVEMYGIAFFRKNCKVYYGGKAERE